MAQCGPGLNSITSRTSGFLPGAPALTRARSNEAKTKSFPGNFPAPPSWFGEHFLRDPKCGTVRSPFHTSIHYKPHDHPHSMMRISQKKKHSPRVFMSGVYNLGLRIHRVKCAIIHHLIHQPRTGARDLHIDEEELHTLRLNVKRRYDARSLLFPPR